MKIKPYISLGFALLIAHPIPASASGLASLMLICSKISGYPSTYSRGEDLLKIGQAIPEIRELSFTQRASLYEVTKPQDLVRFNFGADGNQLVRELMSVFKHHSPLYFPNYAAAPLRDILLKGVVRYTRHHRNDGYSMEGLGWRNRNWNQAVYRIIHPDGSISIMTGKYDDVNLSIWHFLVVNGNKLYGYSTHLSEWPDVMKVSELQTPTNEYTPYQEEFRLFRELSP